MRARHLRLIGAIDEIASFAQHGEALMLSRIRISLRDEVTALHETVDGLIANVGEGMETTPLVLQNLIHTRTNQFADTFREIYPHLPLDRRPPDDIKFFLYRAMGLSLRQAQHLKLVSLTYGEHTRWVSREFSQNFGSEPPVVGIHLPFPEVVTPLRWPLLVHELAHWIRPGGDVFDINTLDNQVDQVAEKLRADSQFNLESGEYKKWTQTVVEELSADRLATNYCGDAYIWAFSTEALLFQGLASPAHSSTGGISVTDRLIALDPDAGHLLQLLDEQSEKSPDYESFERAGGMQLVVDAEPTPIDPERVANLRTKLDLHEQAGSVAPWEISTEQPEGFYERLKQVVDQPATDAEILSAFWLHLVDQDVQKQIERWQKALATDLETDLSSAVAKVSALDTAATRSLETAAVHRWLLKYSERTANPIADNEDTNPLATTAQGGVLSDIQIVERLSSEGANRLVVRPIVDHNQIGGTTIDLRLGTHWEVLRTSRFRAIDPGADPGEVSRNLNASSEEFRLSPEQLDDLVLHPGDLMLVLTLEYLNIPNDLWVQVEGRSTWARLGLQVHATAGMIDAGFSGYLTLELQNTGRLPLVLFPGIRVAQVAFFNAPNIARPYSGKLSASYSAQTSVRSAFPFQTEHRAMAKFREEML